jgi:hypothetical protein
MFESCLVVAKQAVFADGDAEGGQRRARVREATNTHEIVLASSGQVQWLYTTLMAASEVERNQGREEND